MPGNIRKIEEPCSLPDEKGRLTVSGWSESIRPVFDKASVRAVDRFRIRETDHYLFGDDKTQVDVRLTDNGLYGTVEITITDLAGQSEMYSFHRRLFTLGSFDLPTRSDFGDIVYRSPEVSLNITCGNFRRRMTLRCENFRDIRELNINAVFYQEPQDDLVWVCPFKNRHHFHMTDKVCRMPVEATVRIGAQSYDFKKEETMGLFEWNRAVTPYSTRMITCGASAMLDGKKFGFCLGAGSGNRDGGGENIFFYGDRTYKVGEVDITVPKGYRYGTWIMTGAGGEISLRMRPTFEHVVKPSFPWIFGEERHQVFGRYFGTVVLRGDDGGEERITLDGVTGYAQDLICRG